MNTTALPAGWGHNPRPVIEPERTPVMRHTECKCNRLLAMRMAVYYAGTLPTPQELQGHPFHLSRPTAYRWHADFKAARAEYGAAP